MKYYFFRDTDNSGNLLDGKTYHAAGYVETLLDEPNGSGKDIVVTFLEPFVGYITSEWRSLDEVELFEVPEWEYKELVENYDKMKSCEV
jgi:hypothetical protein